MISSTVVCTVANAESGRKFRIRSSRDCWKFVIGINGIIVKKKISEGNTARKKLKEIAYARDVMYP